MPVVDVLDNVVRNYAWGSRTVIATMQGRPAPTAEPEAELWMGAHLSAPSKVVRDGVERTLLDVVTADPESELGVRSLIEHGPRLPFLFKLLAVEEPLSLQVHPDAELARTGYAAEEAAGISPNDPRRCYVDPHHKPELLCAVTDFEALYGFRPVSEAAEVLTQLDTPVTTEWANRLRTQPGPTGLRAVFTEVFSLGQRRDAVLAEVIAACERRAAEAGSHAFAYGLAARLGGRYPGDAGAVISLLLNHLRLAPGEAIFVPAGCLHAYVRGVGVEVMASSDNVIRGGLTIKHVDVAELLRVLRFETGPVQLLPAAEPVPGVREWRPPVSEFRLTRVVLAEANGQVVLTAEGPRIVFCLTGQARIEDEGGEVVLRSGQAIFVPARCPNLRLSGEGVLFQAGIG